MPQLGFINIYEAKTHLSKLCAEAACGRDVILARHGKPWIRITALETAPPKITFGLLKEDLDLAEDFDSPLPPELLDTFEEL